MKRLSTIIMALALVLGMSQCKKQETPTNGNGGEKVYVTLNVSNGESLNVNVNDNGGRHAVAPNLGVIQFRNGDVLYVGHDGKYIGQLTYTDGAFDGELEPPTGNDFLHFYFLGGKAPETEIEAGTTESFNINIADQSQNLPVLCYGHSSQPYTGSGVNYTAVLEYKCALVRFKLNKETDYICTLSNMLTEATIDFANKAITPTATTDTIDLYREEGNTGVRWAILLPGTNLSADGNVSGAPSGTLNANQFINSGITLKNPVFAAPNPANAVKTSGDVLTQFSVSSTQKVYFSKANLKCNAANPDQPVWGFHEYQYDECPGFGTINSTSGTGTSGIHITSSNEMDRFSWGFHSSTPVSEEDWVDGSRNLNWNDGTDWGCALKGTAYGDHWRTLTAAEWEYLLSRNQTYSFLRVTWMHYPVPHFTATARVNGIIIAPDDYNGGPASSYSEWNKAGKIHNFTGNASAAMNLVNELLNDGCVFLPALGYREGSYYYQYNYHYNNSGWYMVGNYWTATGVTQQPGSSVTPQATAFRFEDESINYAYSPQRHLGMAVRLVWDAN